MTDPNFPVPGVRRVRRSNIESRTVPPSCSIRDVTGPRSAWPIRRYRLGEEPSDDLSATTTAEERVAMMESLAREGWALAGRAYPTYSRADTPVTVVRPPRDDGDE